MSLSNALGDVSDQKQRVGKEQGWIQDIEEMGGNGVRVTAWYTKKRHSVFSHFMKFGALPRGVRGGGYFFKRYDWANLVLKEV